MLSQSDRMIVAAVGAGYYASLCGRVYDKNNKEIVGSPLKTSGHLRMTLYAAGVNALGYCSVLKHRFITYYFKGDAVFSSPLIRHRNDIADDNKIHNLLPGTYKENRADIPFSKLSSIGKDNAHLLVARCRKLTDDQIKALREEYANGPDSYLDVGKKFGVSAMTAYRAITKQSWSNV